jgi:hypothetical protein
MMAEYRHVSEWPPQDRAELIAAIAMWDSLQHRSTKVAEIC